MAGTCECDNEPSGSIKCEKFLYLLTSEEGSYFTELVRLFVCLLVC